MKTYGKIVIAFILAGASCHGMAAETGAEPAVAPEANKAMKEIGATLRDLRDYAVEMDVSTKSAVGGGRYREFTGTVHYNVKPPSHLFARVEGQGVERQVFYDGKTITVYAPAQRVYARIEAPGTIRTLLEQVKARKGIELPIADLFAWGTAGGPMSGASRGSYSGTGTMRGRACKHYSFAEAGVSWEVWVDDEHLPCKLAMVDNKDAGLPGYRADINWNTAVKSAETVFQFTPGDGVAEVELSQIAEGDGSQEKQP